MKAGSFTLPAGRRFEVVLQRGDEKIVFVAKQVPSDDYHWSVDGQPSPPRKPITKSDGEGVLDANGVVIREADTDDKNYKVARRAFLQRHSAYHCWAGLDAIRGGTPENPTDTPIEWAVEPDPNKPEDFDKIHAELLAFGLSADEIALLSQQVREESTPRVYTPGDPENPLSESSRSE